MVVNYFTHAKMGMARHMVYMRSKWSAALPVEELRIACVVVVALIFACLLVWCVLEARRTPGLVVSLVLLGVLVAIYAGYTLGVDPQVVRAHIAVSPLLGLSALVQAVNVVVVSRRRKA